MDLDAEEIWEGGIEVARKKMDINSVVAEEVLGARERAAMTQKQFFEKAGRWNGNGTAYRICEERIIRS